MVFAVGKTVDVPSQKPYGSRRAGGNLILFSGLGIAETDVAAGKKQRRENGEQRNYEKTRTPDSRPDQQNNVQNRYREEEQAENGEKPDLSGIGHRGNVGEHEQPGRNKHQHPCRNAHE